MTSDTTRLRRRSLGAFGVAAALAIAVSSTATATTAPPEDTSSGDTTSGDTTSGDTTTGETAPGDTTSGGGAASLDYLIAAATEEGQVNLIALPTNWANYGEVLSSFGEKYPGIEH